MNRATSTRTDEARPAMPTAPPTADRDWRARAACRDVDPELFQPCTEAGPLHEAQVAAAKAVCAGCPVRALCLEFALAVLPCGVAGGLTATERAALRTPASAQLAGCGMSGPGGRKRGSHRASLLIFTAHHALAGDRAPEGTRV